MANLNTILTAGEGIEVVDNTTEMVISASDKIVSVLDYGAVGDDSTDDTAAIQAAEDAAYAGGGVLYFPGNRTYRITDTINRHQGVIWLGGGHNGSNEAEPVQIRWNGAQGGVMVSVDAGAATNILGTLTQGIVFRGTSGANTANTAFRFWSSSATAAKPDTWTGFDSCGFFTFDGDAIRFESSGITNSFIHRSRFDNIDGYAIYVNCNDSNVFFEICQNITWDNGPSGTTRGNGFLFLDGEDSVTQSIVRVKLADFHPEVNASLNQTYTATNVTANGSRGIVRLGVGATGSAHQFDLRFDHVWLTKNPTTAAHSFIQFTSTAATLDAAQQSVHSAAANFVITNLSGLDQLDPIGATGTNTLIENVRTVDRYPFEAASGSFRPKQVSLLTWAPNFPNTDGEGRFFTNMMRTYFTRMFFADAPQWWESQTTVGSAGGASSLPATPTKYLKVKDETGTTYVIPAYAQS